MMSGHVIPLAAHWIPPAGPLVPIGDMMLAQHVHSGGQTALGHVPVSGKYMYIYYARLVQRMAGVVGSERHQEQESSRGDGRGSI